MKMLGNLNEKVSKEKVNFINQTENGITSLRGIILRKTVNNKKLNWPKFF